MRVLNGNPAVSDVLHQINLRSLETTRQEREQADRSKIVNVSYRRQRCKRCNVKLQFLFQLTTERHFGWFARFHLAAGKFPMSRQGLARRTLSRKKTEIGIHQDDADHLDRRSG